MDDGASELADHTAERVLQLIPRIHRWAETQTLQRASDNDLSMRQLAALICIRSQPETLGEIARQLMVTPAVMTSMVDRLEHRGYVRRVIKPGDRRRIYVELTNEGHQASCALEQRLIEAFSPRLAQLSTQEILALDRGLSHLEHVIAAAEAGTHDVHAE